MATVVHQYVNVIGSLSLATWLSITSVEYMSLKELMQVARGTRHMIGEVMVEIYITSLMIYLANADQLQNNNTMMRALLVHNKWSTR